MENYFTNDISQSLLIIHQCLEEKPFITFFIPTFKRSDTLKETIESIKDNRFDFSYQILVIDNSANFGSDNEVRKLISQYPSLPIDYYINKANLGMEGNWNQGILLSKSEYISFVHDDDLISYDYGKYIKDIILTMQKHKKYAYFKARYDFFSDIKDIKEQTETKKYLYKCTKTAALVNGDNQTFTPSCGMVFRKSAIVEAGGFNPSFHPSSDNEIGTRLFQLKHYGIASSWVCGHYRLGFNESMELKTIQSFVEKDYIVRHNNYRLNIFAKLFSCLFEKYLYSSRIDFWIKYSNDKFNKIISIEELDFKKEYKHYKHRPFLLRVIGKLDSCFCKKYQIG